MLPNFNPYTASSEPGQDLAGEARALIKNRGTCCDDEDGDGDGDGDRDGETLRLPETVNPSSDVGAGLNVVHFFCIFLMIIVTHGLCVSGLTGYPREDA